ncbi:hypothetical protein, partial [Halioxenophilus sp. WMMB6]|uniref:hypothetical protein n=1 Tax=Halioxenophilus sp. WMMB6 TaxID=3073815 RepID=UPI00295E7D99
MVYLLVRIAVLAILTGRRYPLAQARGLAGGLTARRRFQRLATLPVLQALFCLWAKIAVLAILTGRRYPLAQARGLAGGLTARRRFQRLATLPVLQAL